MRLGRSAALAAMAALVTGLAPMLAGAAAAAPAVSGSGGPPPPGGGGYAHAVYSQVRITGNAVGGGAVSGPAYPGPPCWLEPRFTGGNSWHPGDPIAYIPGGDADEYWWWFSGKEPSFAPNAHYPGAAKVINDSFRRVQLHDPGGWWWVPAWLQSSGGMACALGLVSSLGLNNGFLDYTPPAVTAHGDNPGTIDGQILADLARAALALPAIVVHTSPMAPAHPSDVNLPLWVWVTYRGPLSPTDTASVPLPGGGVLSATVRTSRPAVSLSVSTGSAQVYQHCGAAGTPYPGGASGLPPCGVTFLAPSTGGPFTLTVTARWTVTWSDSTGAAGGFASPPWPLPLRAQATSVTVREIQAIDTPPPAP